MPLYEYACGSCGSSLEIRQRMTETPLTTCPRCEANTLERLVSATSFALKGGGWYADGYGSAKGAAPTSSDGSAAKSDAGAAPTSESKGTETKPSSSKPETKAPETKAPEKKAANG
ncbi:MAG: zinc ribbon domain-containing protein [Myxococcales bacterium]|nr:zinc ribbon domain-containing protein [Myxococcales bacterium]